MHAVVDEPCHGGCGRVLDRDPDRDRWITQYVNGRPQWHTCPRCQSAEDVAQAARHFATLGDGLEVPDGCVYVAVGAADGEVVDGRQLDTATLRSLADAAEHDGRNIGLDPAFAADLADDAQHFCFLGLSNPSQDRAIVLALIDVQSVDAEDVAAPDGGTFQFIFRFGFAASTTVMEIPFSVWMGSEHFAAPSHWQATTREAVADVLGRS